MRETRGWSAFLDYASTSILHPSARENINILLSEWPIPLDDSLKILNEAKKLFSRIIGSSPNEIALVPNVSHAVATVAYSLPPSVKRRIVTNNLEFPSNRFPWKILTRHGYEVYEIIFNNLKFDKDIFTNALSEKDYMVALSHIFYQNGYRVNLKEISNIVHSRGAYLFVDAYQSIGAISVKSEYTDFLATGSGKWLMSVPGAGFLYVNRNVIDKLNPPYMGWMGMEDPAMYEADIFVPSKTASKLEAGFPSIVSYAGVVGVLREITRIGISNIERRVLSLTGWLIDELKLLKNINVLTPTNPINRGGIVSFSINNNNKRLYDFLLANKVKLSLRKGMIRVSIHYITHEREIEILLSKIKEFLRYI